MVSEKEYLSVITIYPFLCSDEALDLEKEMVEEVWDNAERRECQSLDLRAGIGM